MRDIIIFIVFLIIINYFSKISSKEVVYIISDYDNKKYLVLNKVDKHDAAYTLSVIRDRIKKLVDYLNKNIDKYPDYKIYITQLITRIGDINLTENAPGEKFTSYTVNKGQEISLCLRNISTGKLHNINIITYVAIHEISHVACPVPDHDDPFRKIFIFFLQKSIELKIYKKENYDINPFNYCGLEIKENLLK